MVGDDTQEPGVIKVRGLKTPTSARVKDIIEQDLNDLKATILQDEQMIKAIPGNLDAEVINRVLIPKIIKIKFVPHAATVTGNVPLRANPSKPK